MQRGLVLPHKPQGKWRQEKHEESELGTQSMDKSATLPRDNSNLCQTLPYAHTAEGAQTWFQC